MNDFKNKNPHTSFTGVKCPQKVKSFFDVIIMSL